VALVAPGRISSANDSGTLSSEYGIVMNRNLRISKAAAVPGVILALALVALAVQAPQPDGTREARLIQVLRSGASAQEKDKACRELQQIGTTASIPVLAGLLADRELSHMARFALEPMPYPQAGQALREALSRTESLLKVGIINSLGFRAESGAVPELVPLLQSPDLEVAIAAASALGRIATPDAVLALERLRTAAAAPLLPVAAEASLIAAERLAAGDGPAAGRIYEQLQSPHWPVHVRQGAFAGLLATRPDEALIRVVRTIEGRDPTLKAVAIAYVPMLKAPGAPERIAALLPRLPAETQVPLIDALAGCESRATLGALQKAASSPRPEIALAAVKALGKAGDASTVRVLCGFLNGTPSADTKKEEAIRSLERLRGENVDTELLACLKAAPAAVKVPLIGILTSRRATTALPDLLQEARTGAPEVRVAAVKTVGSWGGADQLPDALEILTGWKVEDGRADVELAVARLSRKIPDTDAQADRIIAALQSATEPAVRCSLLRVLGSVANGKALGAVREALTSSNPDVKETALNTLINWPRAAAAGPLMALWRVSGDPAEKSSILQGVIRQLRRGDSSTAEVVPLYKELLGGARTREERVLILSGLGDVADPAALALVEPSFADPQVRLEAEWCALNVARKLANSSAPEAKRAASRLSTGSQSEEVRKEALELLRGIEKTEDYLMVWQVAGPYSRLRREEPPLFEALLPPEKADTPAQWKSLTLKGRPATPWMLDLAGPLGGARMSAAYARTWLHSESTQSAQLELGIDEPAKVWLNGRLAHLHNLPASPSPVKNLIQLDLKQGWNLLLVKIVQADGPWEFSAKLSGPDGKPLTGVRSDANRGN
jgi:HEAT repeat protein